MNSFESKSTQPNRNHRTMRKKYGFKHQGNTSKEKRTEKYEMSEGNK